MASSAGSAGRSLIIDRRKLWQARAMVCGAGLAANSLYTMMLAVRVRRLPADRHSHLRTGCSGQLVGVRL